MQEAFGRENALAKGIDKVVKTQQVTNEKKFLLVFGQYPFPESEKGPETGPETWDRDYVGRVVLEKGMVRNRELCRVAEDNKSTPATLAVAWVQKPSIDMSVLSIAQSPIKIESLKTAS